MRGRMGLFIALLGLVVGAIIGYVAPALFFPGRDEILSAARSLVPEDADVLDEGENTGSPLIVGSYFVLIFFRGGGPDASSVARTIEDAAESQRWMTIQTQASAPIKTGSFERGGIVSSIRLRDAEGICDPVNGTVVHGVCGSIQAEADQDSIARTRLVGSILGGLLGGATALLLKQRWPTHDGERARS